MWAEQHLAREPRVRQTGIVEVMGECREEHAAGIGPVDGRQQHAIDRHHDAMFGVFLRRFQQDAGPARDR